MRSSFPFVTSRDLQLSIWQSAVATVVHKELRQGAPSISLASHEVRSHARVQGANLHVNADNQKLKIDPPSPSDFEGRSSDDIYSDNTLQSFISQEFFEAAKNNGDPEGVKASLLEDGFPDSDDAIIPWIESFFEYLASHPDLSNPTSQQPYIANADATITYQLPANAKVVILGDYGTGLPDAIAMLDSILADLQPDCIIHVGDIYYAGMPAECQAAIVDVFVNAFAKWGKTIPVFSIPGNHEYLGGGAGYYSLVLPLNQTTGLDESTFQKASYFSLQTADSHWQFVGMDTGFFSVPSVDPTIGPPLHTTEVTWLQNQISQFQGQSILCSHHQLFSANTEINGLMDPGSYYVNDYLMSYFRPLFPKIAAWFWGHEHALGVFEDGLYGLPKGRLIGNSGYEEFEDQGPFTVNNPVTPYASPMVMPGSTLARWEGKESSLINHCCALIDFADTSAPAVSYYEFPVWADPNFPPQDPQLTLIANGQETLSTANPYFIGWTAPLPNVAAYATTNLVTASIADGASSPLAFVSANGVIFALDGQTGAILGSNILPNETGNEIRMLVANQSLFAASESGYVYCLNLASSPTTIWSQLANKFATTTNIAFGNNTLYVGFHGDVWQVDPKTGVPIGENYTSLQSNLIQEVTLAVNGQYLYAGCYGDVFVLDSTTLEQSGQGKIAGPDVSPVNLLVVNGNLYAGMNGCVYGWSADGKASLGTNSLHGSGYHEVRLATDGAWLYAGVNGYVASLSLRDLQYNASWNLNELVNLPDTEPGSNPVNILCNNGALFIGCYGNVFQLNAATGEINTQLPLHGHEVPIGLNGDGLCAVLTGNVVNPGTTDAGADGTYEWQSYLLCVSQDSLT